jgi:O-antigen/teichoic acid export membrane protein
MLPPSLTILKNSIGYGLKSYLACFFAFLVLRADLLMISYMLDTEQAGHYSVSTTLADLLYLLPTAIGTILFPKLSSLRDEKENWALTQKVMWISALILLPIILIAAFMAHPIIIFFYGASFEPAAAPFVILCIAIFFYGINNMISIHLASIGMPWFAVHTWIAASILNIVLNLFLIPVYGISGAAISSLICYSLVLLLQLIFSIKRNTR